MLKATLGTLNFQNIGSRKFHYYFSDTLYIIFLPASSFPINRGPNRKIPKVL
jgi:hypothetical protein